MARALSTRLRRLEGQVGWRLKTLRKPNGDELIVPTGMLIDAWLRVVLDGDPPNLPPHVSRFLADARVRPAADGEFLVALKHECRAIWFPDETTSPTAPMQRVIEADERALEPDPPSPIPLSTRRGHGRGASRPK